MTPQPWTARESFVGRLVGEHVDAQAPCIPPSPRLPDEGEDFTRFVDLDDTEDK